MREAPSVGQYIKQYDKQSGKHCGNKYVATTMALSRQYVLFVWFFCLLQHLEIPDLHCTTNFLNYLLILWYGNVLFDFILKTFVCKY